MPILYRGFSTVNRNKKFRATELDLIKQDILNHFSTRKGERLMDPNFGSIIWSLIFEPLDDATYQMAIDDVTKIVGYDPRVQLDSMVITEQDDGLLIELTLVYLQTNETTNMSLTFDTNSSTITTTGVY
jgi:phage baseplate assembly protein W